MSLRGRQRFRFQDVPEGEAEAREEMTLMAIREVENTRKQSTPINNH